MGSVGAKVYGQQTAHSTRTLHGAAEVEAAEVSLFGLVVAVQDGEEDLAVPEEAVGGLGEPVVVGPRVDHSLRPAAVGEETPILANAGIENGEGRILNGFQTEGLGADEAVFTIPIVGPAAVADEVAVGVVEISLGGLGEEEGAGVAGNEVGAAGAGTAQDGDVGDAEPDRGGGVIRVQFGAPVGALARGCLEIDGDGGVAAGSALDFGEAGDGALGVLVEVVGGVGLDTEVGTAGIAAVGGGLAVADVIESVLELLAGDGGAVGPEAFAGGHLAEGVVLVNPVGGVGMGGLGR